jgi:carbohydrate diacid regulator
VAVALGQVERIAETFVDRASEVFGRVAVLDAHGGVIATSRPDLGRSLSAEPLDGQLRIPIQFGAEVGEVIVGDPINDEAVSPHLARVLVRLMVNQALLLTGLPTQHELKSTFIHTLLRGAVTDEAEIVRQGQLLAMDLTIPRAVVLIDAGRYILAGEELGRSEAREARVRRRAQVVIASVVSFFSLPTDTICAYIGNGEIAVLKASSSHDLQPWVDQGGADGGKPSWANLTALKRASDDLLGRLRVDTRSDISIGIGRYHPGIRGLAASYQDALAALSLGRRLNGGNRVHCLDGLGMAAFVGVADQRTKLELANDCLGPLDHEPELLETVATFFDEECCPSTTAGRLSIHRNTLSYRLEKIATLTGADPRRFDDAIQLRLALLVRSLALPESVPAPCRRVPGEPQQLTR